MESVFPQQPNVGELRQATKLIDFVIDVYDFLVEFLPFDLDLISSLVHSIDLFLEGGKFGSICVSLAFLFV